MANVVRTALQDLILKDDVYIIQDDFTADQSDLFWIDTITDTGTATVGDAVGGIMAITPSDGTVADNDEVYLATANEVFKFAAGKPLYAKARIQYAEGNTDDANVMFGFQNAVAANSLVDNGAGPRTTGSGCGIYKVDGGTKWIVWSVVNDVTTATTSATTAGGASYVTVELEVVDRDSSNGTFTVKINDEYLRDTNGNVIRHTIPYASATEMQLMFGLKNGAATTVETLNIDYVAAVQLR